MDRQIAKPMPMPLDFIVNNGLKMRSMIFGSIPFPVSATEIGAPPGSWTADLIRKIRGHFRRLDHSSAIANNANRKSRAFQSACARSSIENGTSLGLGSFVPVASHVTRSVETKSEAVLKRMAKYDNARGHPVLASSSLRSRTAERQ